MTGKELTKYVHDRCVEEGDCWLWQGVINVTRPQMDIGGKKVAVRRELWKRLKDAEIGRRDLVTASCGVHGCVNPAHLCAVSMSQLQQRAADQGKFSTLQRRAKVAAGRRSQAKLTEQDVRDIRASDESARELAQRLQVTRHAIWAARSGRTWKDYSSPFAGLGA